MGKQKKYYAVARGFKPGIYAAWFGPGGAEEQIRGYAGALYKGFASISEARQWLQNPAYKKSPLRTEHKSPTLLAPGSLPGKNWRAMVSLITATCGVPRPSLVLRPLPRSIGIPIVSKKLERIVWRRTRPSFGRRSLPWTQTMPMLPLLVTSGDIEKVVPVTPGSELILSII